MFFENLGCGSRMRVMPIANQKGGVGKTTTALSLGGSLVRAGSRVLVMDLDPHANASIHLAYYPEQLTATALDLFDPELDVTSATGMGPVWERVIHTDSPSGFHFVAGHIRLSELEMDLKERERRGFILQQALLHVAPHYDYVLVDCPPHVGILLVNAIVAGDELIIPIQTDFLALHGVRLIFDTIRMLNRVLPSAVRYRALPTMYDQRTKACRRVLNILRKKLAGRLFETIIHQDTRFREASAGGTTIFDIAPDSRGAREYMLLAEEIMRS